MTHTWGTWGPSWCWSLLLFAVTIAIHAFGIALIIRIFERLRAMSAQNAFLDTTLGSVAIIVAVTLALATLHAIEALIWAAVYLLLGATPSFADAVLYSVDSMTTRGASDLELTREWRLMGATEAGDGMLLFGISTAFIFYTMVRVWRNRFQS
ncbi:MAG TPA: hypothetical protein VMB20_10190 [Candidatus Acidoferrum sp.]|nr:hypothetical protein [Candidatus Acidoferrum sp.]